MPNSFAADDLLSYATLVLENGSGPDDNAELRGLTALTLCLHDRVDRARELLSTGLEGARRNANRARFLFHMGFDVHRPSGDRPAALDSLRDALACSERSRRLRGEIHIATGLTALDLESPYSAERAFTSALDLHIRELSPFARAGLGRVARLRGQLADALRFTRRARAEFNEIGAWRGVRSCDYDLARLHLMEEKPELALDPLRATITQSWEVLDRERLGTSHRLFARALWEGGRKEEALDASSRAVAHLQASPRKGPYLRALLDFAHYRIRMKDWSAATWAIETARDTAARLGNVRGEFRALAFAVAQLARGASLGVDAGKAAARCQELLTTRGAELSRQSLLEFATGVATLPAAPPSAATGRPPFDPPVPLDVDGLLSARLGNGLVARHAPANADLRHFLLQFMGAYLRSGNYTREFGMTQERAKRQLRTLCEAGVLQRHGTRKASRYSLAFHRTEAAQPT